MTARPAFAFLFLAERNGPRAPGTGLALPWCVSHAVLLSEFVELPLEVRVEDEFRHLCH